MKINERKIVFEAVFRRHRHEILLGTLLLGIGFSHILWTAKDDVPSLGTDSHIYLYNLLDFLDNLSWSRFHELWPMLGKLGVVGRPPLYQILTAPMIVLFGRSEDSALLINLVFFLILALAVYRIGGSVKNNSTGLLATCIVVSYPPIIHLSRIYLPHFAVAATGAVTLWLLLALLEKRSIMIAWWLGFTLAAGLMLHPYYAWVSAVPTFFVGIYLLLFKLSPKYPGSIKQTPSWIARKLRERFVLCGLLPAALIAVAPPLIWYLTWGMRSLEQIARVRSRGIFSIGFSDVEPSFWWYAKTATGVLSNIMCVLAVGGVVFPIFRRRLSTSLLLVTFLAAYSLYSSMHSRWWVHVIAILPVVAILTAVWITSLRPIWLRRAVIGAAAMVSCFNFCFVSFSGPPWVKATAVALGSPLLDSKTCSSRVTAAFCPTPSESGHWPWVDFLEIVSEDLECEEKRPCRVMMVEKPALSLCRYYLVKDRIMNIRLATPRAAWKYRVDVLLESDYILNTRTGLLLWEVPEDRASREFLASPPPLFSEAHQEVASFDLPTLVGRRAQLIKRVKPLTAAEAEEAIAYLALADERKAERFSILARLHAMEGNQEKAVIYYEQVEDERLRRALRRYFEE